MNSPGAYPRLFSKTIMKRRKFSKISGLSLAASIAPNLSHLMHERKLGVALVGLGNYSSRQLAPALEHTKHCQLKGIVTGTPAKEKEWAAKYQLDRKHIYNYENYDAIAEDDEIDIVYVVLPNATPMTC